MIKKIIPWIVFVLLIVLIIVGFSAKDSMNNYVSEVLKEQANPQVREAGLLLIDSLFNYSAIGSKYNFTFLEFGAKGCSSCRQMEDVMADIKVMYPNDVNVVFINVMQPKNRDLMKLFGIIAIPAQVLLDENGIGFFRHTGYLSTDDLAKEIDHKKNRWVKKN